jgi:hypothetical protein
MLAKRDVLDLLSVTNCSPSSIGFQPALEDRHVRGWTIEDHALSRKATLPRTLHEPR